MATIFNTVERAAMLDQPRFVVRIELVWDRALADVASHVDTSVLIHGPASVIADNDGHWSIDDIYPNVDIVPGGSLYQITEVFSDKSSQVYYVDVPDAATPVFWVGDLLTSKPEYLK